MTNFLEFHFKNKYYIDDFCIKTKWRGAYPDYYIYVNDKLLVIITSPKKTKQQNKTQFHKKNTSYLIREITHYLDMHGYRTRKKGKYERNK